jgi:acetyltransferase
MNGHSEDERFKGMDLIFHPQSIAVVGASENKTAFGFHFMRYVTDYGYKGKIFPVHPNMKHIMGHRAYSNFLDIPENVDYVICCIKADLVIDLIAQCKSKHVKAIHLLTGRFSEIGTPEAAQLEKDIYNAAKKSNIRLIGPNCMGVYCPASGLTFNYDLPMEPGPVGGIAQSGGLAGEIVRYASLRGVGFSKVISIGNAVDINECDLLEYFYHDPETKIIFMYLEGTRHGQKLIQILRNVSKKKPVIIINGGRSQAGKSATASHTASISSAFSSWETVFKQCNVVKALNLEELGDLLVAFSMLPVIRSKRVGIIGGGGGKGVLSADDCEESGLIVHPLPDNVITFLKEKDPLLVGWIKNPVDFSILAGSRINPLDMLSVLAESKELDMMIALLTEDNPFDEQGWSMFVKGEIENYIQLASKPSKPFAVIINSLYLNADRLNNWRWAILSEGRQRLIKNKIPVFSSSYRAATAINKLINYYTNGLETKNIKTVSNVLQPAGQHVLSEISSKALLKKAGIPVNETFLAKTEQKVVEISTHIGFPVVLKIASEDIIHKTDVQGVQVNIKTHEEATNAYRMILSNANQAYPKANISGVTVQKMLADGIELVAGVSTDSHFGSMIMFGIGGTFVELLKDVSFRFTPIDINDALHMIAEIKHQKLLDGYRGQVAVDRESVAHILVALSDFVLSHPEITEIDINPLIATCDGIFAADARIVKKTLET